MAQSKYKCPTPFENALFFSQIWHSEPENGVPGCRFLKKKGMDCYLAKNTGFCWDQGKHREKLLGQNSPYPENTYFCIFTPVWVVFVVFRGIWLFWKVFHFLNRVSDSKLLLGAGDGPPWGVTILKKVRAEMRPIQGFFAGERGSRLESCWVTQPPK